MTSQFNLIQRIKVPRLRHFLGGSCIHFHKCKWPCRRVQLAGKNISRCIPSYTCTQSVPRDFLGLDLSPSIFGTRCSISSLVHPFPSGAFLVKPPVSDMFPNETLIVGSFDMIQCTIFGRWKFATLHAGVS